jgi:hypothetical protein
MSPSYSEVTLTVTITASSGDGMTQSDLDLTVLEGLRQLGLDNVKLEES